LFGGLIKRSQPVGVLEMAKRWIPSVKEFVQIKTTGKIGKVIEVNMYWGWCKVEFEDGKIKHYNFDSRGNTTIKKWEPEIVAQRNGKTIKYRINNPSNLGT
jgi:hypothetical protein